MGTIGGNLCVDTRCTYYNQTEEWRRVDRLLHEGRGRDLLGGDQLAALLGPHRLRLRAHALRPGGAGAAGARAQASGWCRSSDLYHDDGIRYLAKQPDEILTARPPAGGVRRRVTAARPSGSCAAAARSTSPCCRPPPRCGPTAAVRSPAPGIFLGAVASFPTPAEEAEAFLTGKEPTPEALAEAARLARKSATPIDNTDFQAQWRGVMVARYTEAALREAAGLDPGRPAPRHEMAVAGT